MVVQHGHLPKNPQTSNDLDQWRDWAASASSLEVFEAFITRLSHSRVGQPDLEPVQRLLVDKLRTDLQPEAADIAPLESEAV